MGGNEERAREPSRICWPRGERADVRHTLSRWGPEQDMVSSQLLAAGRGWEAPWQVRGRDCKVGGQDPG